MSLYSVIPLRLLLHVLYAFYLLFFFLVCSASSFSSFEVFSFILTFSYQIFSSPSEYLIALPFTSYYLLLNLLLLLFLLIFLLPPITNSHNRAFRVLKRHDYNE